MENVFATLVPLVDYFASVHIDHGHDYNPDEFDLLRDAAAAGEEPFLKCAQIIFGRELHQTIDEVMDRVINQLQWGAEHMGKQEESDNCRYFCAMMMHEDFQAILVLMKLLESHFPSYYCERRASVELIGQVISHLWA